MMHHLIKPTHLDRWPYVYLRQSSPDADPQEPRRTATPTSQWSSTSPAWVGRSRGSSCSTRTAVSPAARSTVAPTLHRLLEAIVTGKAGLVAARELSRLVRDNQDWGHLVRLCRFKNVLLADEHRIYDPADPQDRMVLGIQGAFNEFELSMILDRMHESLRQKGQRGEQYDALPTGYICRHPPLCEKHPDQRVQRAVEKVLHDFERFSSARQLYLHLLDEKFQLPVVKHGRDWREVEWITPSYSQILEFVRNPTYAGMYVTRSQENDRHPKRRRA